MYAYIKGKLKFRGHNYVIVDNSGIGYKIMVSAMTQNKLGELEDEVTVYTHHHVREDNISLFGFASLEEINMFELLITVSGIGPKIALAVLEAITPSEFALAVVTNDIKAITKAQGVGNKAAQKIILELKDKLGKDIEQDLSNAPDSVPAVIEKDDVFGEAVSALVVLGHTQQEAYKLVSKVFEPGIALQELIKKALNA